MPGSRAHRDHHWSRPTARPLRGWIAPVLASSFVMAGYFKGAYPFSRSPVDLTLALGIATLAICCFRVLRSGELPVALGGVLVGFLFLLPAALSLDGSAYGVEKAGRLFTLTLLAALCPVILVRTELELRRLLWAWTAVCGIIALASVLAPTASAYAGAPIAAAGSDTIALGRASGITLVVIVLARAWHEVRWSLVLPIACVALYSLLQSGSRGPLFAAGLAILATFVLSPSRPSTVSLAGLASLLIIATYFAFNLAPVYSQQRLASLVGGHLDSSSSARLVLYQEAWQSLQVAPLGTGWGGFAPEAGGLTYPHNIILEVLAEDGLIWGTFFVSWLIWEVTRARRLAWNFSGSAIFGAFVYMLLNSLVSGDINDNRALFFVVGLAAVAASVGRADDRIMKNLSTSVAD